MIVDVAVEHGCAMDEYVRLGALAKRYGIGTLWAPNGTSSRDAFVSLSGLARASSRIRMGVQAMSPYEMHPLKIANALLTLNELASGRASILVGGGGAIFGAIGGKPVRRVRSTQECIDILRRAGTGQTVNYAGEIFTVRNYRPQWAVQPPPRVLAGANLPQMLRMAARSADGIMMSDMPLPRVGVARPRGQGAGRSRGPDPHRPARHADQALYRALPQRKRLWAGGLPDAGLLEDPATAIRIIGERVVPALA